MKIVYSKIIAGRNELLRAEMTTTNKVASKRANKSDESMKIAIAERHGSLNMYIFHIQMSLPQRVHTHLRTHSLLNDFYVCSTSRPDLTDTDGETRLINFYIPLKRWLEVCSQRKCKRTWGDSEKAINLISEKLEELEPALKNNQVPSCILEGRCKEIRKSCGWYKSEEYKKRLTEYNDQLEDLRK